MSIILITSLSVQLTWGASSEETSAPNLSKRWSPLQARDYWSTGLMTAGALSVHFLAKPDAEGWGNGILFDDSIRSMLRAQSSSARKSASLWSDQTRNLVLAAPILLDAVALQWLKAKDTEGAWNTVGVSAQSFAFTLFMGEVTKTVVGRKRPYQKECASDSGYESSCNEKDAFRSFFSGHASIAFTGAGLVCVNHSKLDLYQGNTTADALTCAGAVTLATATSVLRLVADRHYASDVLVGAALGFFSGYYLPTLLHSTEGSAEKPKDKFMILPAGEKSAGLFRVMHF